MSSTDEDFDRNAHIFEDGRDLISEQNVSSDSEHSVESLDMPSSQGSMLPSRTSSQPPLTPATQGISTLFSESLNIDSPPPPPLPPFRGRRKIRRRKGAKFLGNKYVPFQASSNTPRSTRPSFSKSFKLPPMRGYSFRVRHPRRTKSNPVQFNDDSSNYTQKAHIPQGSRIIDMSILSEVVSTFRCLRCNRSLCLWEDLWKHGWQTFFRIKYNLCHIIHASFPSSRSLDIPDHHTCVNIPPSHRGMNNATLRAVLATHTTSMSWRDLHRFSTIFDMPTPQVAMPPKYLERLESITKAAVETSMTYAGKELRNMVDSVPSIFPNCTSITISFDASWHTRGFYSNIGFGSAISTKTKKVLDYELLSRNCEKCTTWTEQKIAERQNEYANWMSRHKPN